jgi:hypothetical protein
MNTSGVDETLRSAGTRQHFLSSVLLENALHRRNM